ALREKELIRDLNDAPLPLQPHRARLDTSASTPSATLSARAMIVRYGLISSASGKRLESATRSHGMSCTRPRLSVTESLRERPMPQPPIRCAAETVVVPGRK